LGLDDFLDKAGSEGAFESSGHFSIDWTSAERKLAEFYRQHPRLWFVKFIQAAVTMNCTSIHVTLARDTLRILMRTQDPPTSLTDLGTSDEAAEYLRTGLRAVFGGEDGVASIVLTRLPRGGAPEILTLQRGQPQQSAVINPSPGEADKDDADNRFQVEIIWSKGTWWQNLRQRIRRQTSLYRLCGDRLAFCPVPVYIGMLGYGQGTGKAYDAVAAEYIVGPLTEDTIVRENEPGHGSQVVDVFGERVNCLGGAPRVFTRWCESSHPLLSKGREAKAKLHIYPRPLNDPDPQKLKQRVPNNSVPIFQRKAIQIQLVAYVEMHPDFRPPGSQNGVDTPGLPIYVCIVIPSQPSGPSLISFYRRGVYLCHAQAELGIPGIDVKVCCSALKTDFSGMRIVNNEAYEQLLPLLRDRVLKLAQDTVSYSQGLFRRTRALEKILDSRAY
jgi:hypothetical protein